MHRPEQEEVAEGVAQLQSALVVERDLMPFDASTANAIERLLRFLRRSTTEVRLYRKRFLHGKAFVFGHEAGVIAGSANFTANGLVHNLELDLGQYEPERVQQVHAWYDQLWEEAEPYDLAAIFAARTATFDPYTIYLRMLYELYGEEPELQQPPAAVPGPAALRLASFQRLGVLRAQRILDRYSGVLIADGVGLGKTYLAGEILRSTVRDEALRALLVTPASLRDSTWERFLSRHQLYVENVSYQQLAADTQVNPPPPPGEPDRRAQHLRSRADEYRLIVVDEAHAFRNPETLHYRALRRLMAAGATPKKLVLLTATPVNNSLMDLYHQVMLFARHEAAFADIGILSLRQLFSDALSLDLEELTPHLLFPVLDAISVRRTRRHIQRYYADEEFGDPPRRISFPRPHLRSCRYRLSEALPGFFDEVAGALETQLTLAAYVPDAYRRTPVATGRQEVLAGLLRSQLLKRFESSLGAFRKTLDRLIRTHDSFLGRLGQGYVIRREVEPDEVVDELGDEAVDVFVDGEPTLAPAAWYDQPRLRAAVEADRAILERLLERASSVRPADDPKLRELMRLLRKFGEQEVGDARKVIFFSYFADTVSYVREHLDALGDRALGPYAGRYTSISGADSPDERQRVVWAFSPKTTDPPGGQGDDRYDLLLATDALAEGQNLQQAGQLINFDLPWNPMRLVQRNGRIDRLWSEHEDIYLYSFFPETELDELLGLEERLRNKIAQANAAVGIETSPLPGTRGVERTFADAEERIRAIADEDEGVLEAEEAEVDAFSGELFREELRRALLQGRGSELKALPWGAGSGMRKAVEPGVVFAARIGRERLWRFVPVTEAALRADLLGLLDLARCGAEEPRYLPRELEERLFVLWAKARDDIYGEYMARLDPISRQAAVPKAQRDAVTLLQGVPVDGAGDAIAALQVPWPVQVSRQLRRLLHQLDRPDADADAVAREVVSLVRDEGLRPPPPAAPPPHIEPSDVHLVCFQVVAR